MISVGDHVQMVPCPSPPVNTTTAKAVTAAILTLYQALDRMEGVKDSMDMDKNSFYRVLGAGGAG